MKRIFALSLIFVSTTAFAQQAEQIQDPKYQQRIIELLQIQRNQANDSSVVSEARARGLADELLTAKNKIKDLETEVSKLKGSK